MLNDGSVFMIVCAVLVMLMGVYFIILNFVWKINAPNIDTDKKQLEEKKEGEV